MVTNHLFIIETYKILFYMIAELESNMSVDLSFELELENCSFTSLNSYFIVSNVMFLLP